MLSLFKKDRPSNAAIHFPGNLPTRAEEFAFLTKQHVEIKPLKPPASAHWSLRLSHPQWGTAEMMCPKGDIPVPTHELEYIRTLDEGEKSRLRSARSAVFIRTAAERKYVLRDRKNLLRYAGAVLGSDGVAAYDMQSMLWWSRSMLDDELAHDADLDIDSLYCIHAVTDSDAPSSGDDERTVRWLHTHGLAELGAFDFDILHPHPDVVSGNSGEAVRALAFSIAEGRLAPDESRFQLGIPSPTIRLVPADQFMRAAPPEDRAVRDMDDDSHQKNRSIVCEPVPKGLRSFLGGGKPRANRSLQEPGPEQGMVCYSPAATELMAYRARQTVDLLRSIAAELAPYPHQVIAKIGYRIDGGAPDEREHMWFEVHGFEEGGLDATLQVVPFNIERMHRGDRGIHPIEQLTDWMVNTPVGTISPRSLSTLRLIRENPEVAKALAEYDHSADS